MGLYDFFNSYAESCGKHMHPQQQAYFVRMCSLSYPITHKMHTVLALMINSPIKGITGILVYQHTSNIS